MAPHTDVLIHPPTAGALSTPSRVLLSASIPLPGVSTGAQNWYDKPADASNTGWTNSPGYTGSVTSLSAASVVSNTTYTNRRITGGPLVLGSSGSPLSNVTFNGCDFVVTSPENVGIQLWGDNIAFNYCTVRPNLPWSSGIGQTMTTAQSFQYGIGMGSGSGLGTNITVSHVDIWGYGEAFLIGNAGTNGAGSGPYTFDHCWIHDACTDDGDGTHTPGNDYHTDGIGWLNGSGGGANNVTITYCTIESVGNTNGLAFQNGSYDTITVQHCYLGGWGYGVSFWPTNNTKNVTFTDNVWSTELKTEFGPLREWSDTHVWKLPGYTGNNNLWARNKWHSKNPSTGLALGQGDPTVDGYYWLPVGVMTHQRIPSGGGWPITQYAFGEAAMVSTSDYVAS